MKKLLIGILALAVMGSSCDFSEVTSEVTDSVPRLYNKCKKGVVYVNTLKMTETGLIAGLGSGFVYKVTQEDKIQIITAAHVVFQKDIISITFYNGSIFNCKIINIDEGRDLALLELTTKADTNSPDPEYIVLALANLSKVKIGEKVILIGHPLGLSWSITTGVISAIRKNLKGPGFIVFNAIQTDTDIIGGNSGGPLLNTKGEVLGIVSFGSSAPRGGGYLGFCISCYDIDRFVNNLPGQVNPNIKYISYGR